MRIKAALWIACGACALTYAFAWWGEAAYYAGQMEFNETISWSRLMDALAKVTRADLARVEIMPTDFLVLPGSILVALLAAFIHRPSWRRVSLGFVTGLAALLLGFGGGLGILVLLIPGTIDGEYFAESCARLAAAGIWTLAVLTMAIAGWRHEAKQPLSAK